MSQSRSISIQCSSSPPVGEEGDILLTPREGVEVLVEDLLEDVFSTGPDATTNSAPSSGTPLVRAIRRGSMLTSSFLTKYKAEDVIINETDRHGRNAVHYAATKPDVLMLLLEEFKTSPSIKECFYHEDKEGETPIHRAASFGNSESLEILYEYDHSLIELRTKITKSSVLHFAVVSRSVAAVQFVLRKVPQLLNVADNMSRTPAHYAAGLKQSDIIKILISNDADIFIRDANEQVPIHAAANKGYLSIVQSLVRVDPDCIEVVDNMKQTALMLAAMKGFPNVVSYLLNKEANYLLRDNYNYTAFDWAIKYKRASVIKVFLDKPYWKKVMFTSRLGPEKCLTMLVETMPEMAQILLDKCITVKGTKKEPEHYQVTYDFFCLKPKGENKECPQFEALSCMAKNEGGLCLSHPLCVKYVNMKWRKRGFKFHLASILIALLFHICLMAFTTKLCGVIITEKSHDCDKNKTRTIHNRRNNRSPDDDVMMALRVIMLVLIFGTIIKELCQIKMQRLKYLNQYAHYNQWVLNIVVVVYLLPVHQEIDAKLLISGSIAVFCSWTSLMQFLRIVPGMGVCILVIQKVFRTLIKIFVMVVIFLLSFATTFYIILTEHSSFNNLGISIVSTFFSMISGISNYEHLFVKDESLMYPGLYEFKLIVLVVFILVMAIVVNNTLIGLAVGDAHEVLKSAKFEKFRRKANFIIHLEKSIYGLPGIDVSEAKFITEFPERKKKGSDLFLDLIYYGGKLDDVDGASEREETTKGEEEWKMSTIEDHVEKVLEAKIENLGLALLKEMADNRREDMVKRKEIEDKIDTIFAYITRRDGKHK